MVENVEESVRSIIASRLSVDAASLRPEQRIEDDLGADSLDTVELAIAIEDSLGFQFPSVAIERLRTVGDAIEFTKEALAGASC